MIPPTAFAIVAGLLIGSFLDVCVYRLPNYLSVVRPLGHKNGHTLASEEVKGVPKNQVN